MNMNFVRNANGTIKSYRQGDVHVIAVQSIPAEAKKEQRKGDVILAHGEVTGHAHRIKSKKAATWSADAERFLQVMGSAPVTHEEHRTIPFDPHGYIIVIQVEYSPAELRNVAD